MTRHLIYHVMPTTGEHGGRRIWRRNVEQLLGRIHQFDGRRVACVVTGDGCDDARAAIDLLRPHVDDVLVRSNDALSHAAATFPLLMQAIAWADADAVTFYAHTKGVTRAGGPYVEACQRWATVQYETCLDYPTLCDTLLAQYPIVGSFLREGTYPGVLGPRCRWHYSGTFFWFRNADVFTADWLAAFEPRSYGVEAWPGVLFPRDKAGLLFLAGGAEMRLHRDEYWALTVEPAYRRWRAGHGAAHRPPRDPPVALDA